jgi:hypothetical protein
MNDTKLNGRRVYLPIGRDRSEDACILADCIAGGNADLFDQDGSVMWVAAGRCVPVNPEVLREICKLFVVTKHPRENANGLWEVEYRPYESDQKTLHTLLMAKTRAEGSLMARLPKGPVTLNNYQQHEARGRIERGEPLASVARHYGIDIDVIKELARG